MIIQKIKKEGLSPQTKAQIYYRIVGNVNGLPLTERDSRILAHAAIFGLDKESKEEFCRMEETTMATLSNSMSKLRRLGLLTKENFVHSTLKLDFKDDVAILTTFKGGSDGV